jgi:hypothetical protein
MRLCQAPLGLAVRRGERRHDKFTLQRRCPIARLVSKSKERDLEIFHCGDKERDNTDSPDTKTKDEIRQGRQAQGNLVWTSARKSCN